MGPKHYLTIEIQITCQNFISDMHKQQQKNEKDMYFCYTTQLSSNIKLIPPIALTVTWKKKHRSNNIPSKKSNTHIKP